MSRKKEFVPIVKPTLPDLVKIMPRVKDIWGSGMITNYKYTRELEKKAAKYFETKNVVALSNCTSGLMLACKCLELKGEVIVPSFTFDATACSLVWNNLTPVFAEIDNETFNIDVDKIEEKITDKTSAILAVHMFGNPCNIDELQEIAGRHNLKLIFDSAHAFGAKYKGKTIGKFGDAEVFSMTPTKVLTAGEGGLVTTNNSEFADLVRHGMDCGNYKGGDDGGYVAKFVGLSSRLTEFNAILALEGLKNLEKHIEHREKLARIYEKRLGGFWDISFQKSNGRMSRYAFPVIVGKEAKVNRDIIAKELERQNVQTKRMYFYPALHEQPAYKQYAKGGLPATDYVSRHIICLPIYSHLEKEKVEGICDIIENLLS